MDAELLANEDFVRGLARRLIADEHLAEDLVQDAWVAALRNPPADDGAARAWFARVVRNLSFLALRRRGRREARERTAARPERIPSTDSILEREVEKLRLVEAVQALDEPYRTTVVLRFYENLPPREISRHLDVPVETVKTRLQRALGRLRTALDRAHGGDGRKWCLALAPVAGLSALAGTSATAAAAAAAATAGSATAGSAAAATSCSAVTPALPALLKGVLAMSINTKIGLALAAVVLIGAALVLWQGDGDPDGNDLITLPHDQEATEPAPEEIGPDDGTTGNDRIALLPDEGEDSMPASYRNALGGFCGRIVHGDGKPAPGKDVEIYGLRPLDLLQGFDAFVEERRPAPRLARWDTVSGEDGRFEIGCVYPRAWFVLVADREGTGRTSTLVDAQPGPGETVDLGDIALAEGAALTGTIVDERGVPLAGARVRVAQVPPFVFSVGVQDFREGCAILAHDAGETFVIEPPPDLFRIVDLFSLREAITGADGAFRLDGVPRGPATFVVDRAGCISSWKGIVAPPPGKDRNLGTIEMEEGLTIRGKVVDGSARPVPGVEVRVGPFAGDFGVGILQAAVTTGADGGFAVPGMPSFGTCSAALRRGSASPWKITGPFPAEGPAPVLVLDETFDFTLTVADAEGRSVPGTAVKVQAKSMQNLIPLPSADTVVPTEEMGEGTFAARNLAPGRYEFAVTAPGYGSKRSVFWIDEGPVEREVTLETGVDVAVRVVAKESGTPIAWAEVLLKHKKCPMTDEEKRRLMKKLGIPVPDSGSLTSVSFDSAAEKTEDWFLNPLDYSRRRTGDDGIARFRNVGPGEYVVVVSHPGHSVGKSAIDLPADEEVLVSLKPGGAIEGVFHFGRSGIEPPFAVVAMPEEGTGFPETDMPRMALTDLEGSFRLKALGAGTWKVVVMKRLLGVTPGDLLRIFSGGALAQATVDLRPGETAWIELGAGATVLPGEGSVTGHVLVDGVPARGATVVVWCDSAEGRTAVDASGRFRMESLPAGRWPMRVTVPPGPRGAPGFNTGGEVVVTDGLETVENFDIATATIIGRVEVRPEGIPLAGAEVVASGGPGVWDEEVPRLVPDGKGRDRSAPFDAGVAEMRAVTDRTGRFRLEGIPAGRYSLRWISSGEGAGDHLLEGAESQVTTVEVSAGNTAGPVVVKIHPKMVVRGRIEIPADVPPGKTLLLIVRPAKKVASPRKTTVSVSETGVSYSFSEGKVVHFKRETGAFEITDIVPGKYIASLLDFSREGRESFEPMPFSVPEAGLDDLVLRGVREKEE